MNELKPSRWAFIRSRYYLVILTSLSLPILLAVWMLGTGAHAGAGRPVSLPLIERTDSGTSNQVGTVQVDGLAGARHIWLTGQPDDRMPIRGARRIRLTNQTTNLVLEQSLDCQSAGPFEVSGLLDPQRVNQITFELELCDQNAPLSLASLLVENEESDSSPKIDVSKRAVGVIRQWTANHLTLRVAGTMDLAFQLDPKTEFIERISARQATPPGDPSQGAPLVESVLTPGDLHVGDTVVVAWEDVPDGRRAIQVRLFETRR